MNTKNNKNYQNSQNSITDAFFTLLKKKGIDANITVSEICLLSQVNRSTFYRHYIDVEDLADKICMNLQTSIEVKDKTINEIVYDTLIVIENNKCFFNYYLRKNSNQFDNPYFMEMWKEKIVPIFISKGVKDENKMEYYFSYFTGGFLAIIYRWIKSDCKEPREEIYHLIDICINNQLMFTDGLK